MHGRIPTALAIALAAAACDTDSGSPPACAHAVAQDLDAGRYDAALERLDSRACEAALTSEQLEINRGAAYVGKAGYDVADILLVVLDTENESEDTDADVRLLESLSGLGEPGGLRNLARANAAYQLMVEAFTAGLDEACRDDNVPLLTRLQLDACFNSGLLAYARLARGFDLLLQNELAAFLGLEALDCDTDRNFSGKGDEAEISACALRARRRLDEGGGVCLEPGMRDGEPQGGIGWERVAGVETVAFFEDGVPFATLVPVRVTTEPGGTCEGARTDLRLLQPRSGRSAELMLTGGVCETEITRSCAAVDPNLGCWPCPIPRLSGEGAVSVTETVLDAVNFEAERSLSGMTDVDREEVEAELEEAREAFCAPLEGTPEECDADDDATVVSLEAIREYLRR